MHSSSSFRPIRMAAVRKKNLALAVLVLFVGASALIDAIPDVTRSLAALLFAGLLLAAVTLHNKRKAVYGLAGLALLAYAALVQPAQLFPALMTAYSLLLFYALFFPNPLYTLAAALAVALNLYAYAGWTDLGEWTMHLFFIALNAVAYASLAFYARKLEKERNEYRHLSMIDSLTGLASLQQTMQFGTRLLEEGRPVRVLLIDLDFFKQINDTYGHMVGNKVIKHVADYLRKLVQPSGGIAGRLGGDEFVVVLEDEPRFAKLRQRLLDELGGTAFVPDEALPPLTLSFSVGEAVSSPERRLGMEDLLHDADLNMYEFKLHHRLPTFQGKTADLIEHSPDPICTFDRKGKLVAVNPATSKMLGYAADEMPACDILSLIHPGDRHKALAGFRQTMHGHPQQLELRVHHKEGRLVIVDVTNIPILADHQIVGIYGVAKDVTDRKKAEELLAGSDRLAVTGQLAAGLAHEIRNPLTALKGFVQLLQSSPTGNKAYYPIMLNELERINFIVNEFLLLSKPRPASFRETAIGTVIEHVAALLETQAIMSNVRIAIEQVKDMPPIRCDENQMKQAFVHVLKNAIEAMPDGGEVAIRAERKGRLLVVSFSDEGSGIPEELASRVGQPFFTTKENGTGLGLMICRNIMESHGGKLSIFGKTGGGTSVEIELPYT